MKLHQVAEGALLFFGRHLLLSSSPSHLLGKKTKGGEDRCERTCGAIVYSGRPRLLSFSYPLREQVVANYPEGSSGKRSAERAGPPI
jgi:hypothetical protein